MARKEQSQTYNKTKSRIPRFKSIEEEAEFWDTHDLAEFEDELQEVTDVRFVMRRSRQTKALTVRVDEDTLATLTREATNQGIGPSTLVRMWILERLKESEKNEDPSSTSKAS